MKRLAALAITAGLLLTGCSAKSEEWLAAKHECIVAGWQVNEGKANRMTFTEIEEHCNRVADGK